MAVSLNKGRDRHVKREYMRNLFCLLAEGGSPKYRNGYRDCPTETPCGYGRAVAE